MRRATSSLLALLLAASLATPATRGAIAGGPPDPPPPAAPPAPTAPVPPAEPSAAIPDPTPYLAITGAALRGVSRDGKTVLFLMQRDSVAQLFRTSPDGGWPTRLTFRQDGVDFASLSPDGTRAVVGWDKDGDENYGLYLVSTTEPAAERPLSVNLKVRHGGVVWAREGDRIFFHDNADGEADFHVKELTLSTGAVRTLLARAGDWSVDDAAPGGKRLLVSHARSNYDMSLYVLDTDSGALTAVDEASAGTMRAPEDSHFLGAGDEVAFSSDRDGEWRRPYVARLSDGAVRPLIAGDDGKAGPDAEGLTPTADGKTVYVVWNEEGRGRVAGVTVATGAAAPAPDVGDALAGGVTVDDLGRVFFTLSTATAPGAVVRWDPGTDPAAIRPLTYADLNGLPASAFPAAPKAVRYPSFDGKEIPAWLYLPHGAEQMRALPFIVSLHGGPEAQERPFFWGERAYLLSLGYGILAPNVRGSTGYGRTWRDLDNYKGRLDAVRDGKAAADWLVKSSLALPGRIAAMGGSYGGYMVLAELTEFPGAFAAGIECFGISNFETFLERTASYRRTLREAEYGPLTDREFLRSISPIHKVDAITAPLLVCQGEKDPRVPVEEARQIEKALKDLHRPVQSLYFKDEGHGFTNRANKRKYLMTVAEFLKKSIGR